MTINITTSFFVYFYCACSKAARPITETAETENKQASNRQNKELTHKFQLQSQIIILGLKHNLLKIRTYLRIPLGTETHMAFTVTGEHKKKQNAVHLEQEQDVEPF
jgi:hypothetical protein